MTMLMVAVRSGAFSFKIITQLYLPSSALFIAAAYYQKSALLYTAIIATLLSGYLAYSQREFSVNSVHIRSDRKFTDTDMHHHQAHDRS